MSHDRAGISAWSGPNPGDGGSPSGDDVVDLDAAAWPPCPACQRHRLRRDPNSTDLLFTDDLPPAEDEPPPVGVRRRASDRYR